MDLAWSEAGAVGLDPKRAASDRLFLGVTGVLSQDMAGVKAVGISQTPTFFLNCKRLDNVSAESLISDVKAAVESV